MKYHAAVAAELLGSEELVAGALQDPENSALPEKEKAMPGMPPGGGMEY